MKSSCCNVEVSIMHEEKNVYLCKKCSFPCDAVMESYEVNNLIKAYKLGYADRNVKMTPFGDQDPKEYILYHLKNM